MAPGLGIRRSALRWVRHRRPLAAASAGVRWIRDLGMRTPWAFSSQGSARGNELSKLVDRITGITTNHSVTGSNSQIARRHPRKLDEGAIEKGARLSSSLEVIVEH